MSNPTLLYPDGRPVPAADVARVRGAAMVDQAYRAASRTSEEMASWNPVLQSADGEMGWTRDTIVARVRDVARNDGWASAGLTRMLDNVIGADLKLSSRPDWRALGIDAEAADDLADRIEAEWRGFANDPLYRCDAARADTMGGLFRQAYRAQKVDGEALSVLRWKPETGARYATALAMIDTDRLSNPGSGLDTETRRRGVEIDADGAAVGYHIQVRHPSDWWSAGASSAGWRWEYLPRYTSWGRPNVVHHFDRDGRVGMTRGVSVFAPILERLYMLYRYDRVELQAAALNAILAAYIESPFDHELLDGVLAGKTDELSAYQSMRAGYHAEKKVTLGGVRIPALYPGEKLGFQNAARPHSNFAAFESAVLGNIAGALGITREQLTGDLSRVNYSSLRGGLVEIWKTMTADRRKFVRGFVMPVFVAWLEEAFTRGYLDIPPGAPAFHDAIGAYASSHWVGPGRGWVDPTREAEAARLRMLGQLTTLQDEVAEQGGDWQENLRQIARENRERARLGVPLSDPAPLMMPPPPDTDEAASPDDSNSRGGQAA